MKTRRLHRSIVSLCLFALLFPQSIFGQQNGAKKFELTVDSMMRGNALVGYEPTRVYWSQDGQRIYFRWKRAGEPRLKESDLYVANRDGSGLRKLTEDEARLAPPLAGDPSKDKKMTVYTDDGDIFIYDHVKNERRQLTSTVDGDQTGHHIADRRVLQLQLG